jgi:protein O-mannosyl-transferase
VAVLLAFVVFATFSPALQNDFTGYDDPDYVLDNPHVRGGLSAANLYWAATAVHASNWHPLTWASHMLDSTLFGVVPRGHHLTSVLFHVVNTLLLFLLLHRDTGRAGCSAVVAGVFGVHPLHVESVAWVAERKDVLSTLFWLLTMWAHGAYARRPGGPRYAVVVVLFAAGLAAKPMLVTLPLVLLLWDVWPLGRYPAVSVRRLLIEKVPLLALAILSSVITVYAQRQGGSLAGIEPLPIGLRAANAVVSYVRYLGKTVWPVDLAAFYPMETIPAATLGLCLVLLAAVSWLAAREWRRRPWLAVGWGWYLVTLVPVIGWVQVGQQALADRYMYVPMIGLLIAVAWGIAEGASHRNVRHVSWAAAVVGMAGLAALSWRQVHVWKDGITLWTHALRVTEGNFIAHNNLGVELDRRGRPDEAIAHYRETLRIRPGDRNGRRNHAGALVSRGERLYRAGQLEAALASFRDALRQRPDHVQAHAYVGAILVALGRYDDALAAYDAALAAGPGEGSVHADRAVVLHALGRNDEAWRAIEAARERGAEPAPELIESLRRQGGRREGVRGRGSRGP